MEIEWRALRERVVESIVVFVVLLVFGSLQGSSDWVALLATPAVFFTFMIAVDAVRRRASE